MTTPTRALGLLLVGAVLLAAPASAQEAVTEEPDPTRLDVERLPPEAIEVTRDLYAHGLFVEAAIGVRGFVGGVGDFSKPGPHLTLGVGYEIARWLYVRVAFEASMHATDAPSPPTPTVFELVGGVAEVRVQLNASARVALWLGGEFGISTVTSDVLTTYGINDSDDIGLVYGGQLGLDWHMKTRHHSIGLSGGARVYPGLQGFDGSVALGIHGNLYLRYVFGSG